MTVATSNNRVFISYRRATSAFVARAVYQDLSAHRIDAFIDVENINAGDFDRIIAEKISSRPYFLLVLSPGTLERCQEGGDWLRREIEYALRAKRVIIPLNTSEFNLADKAAMPPSH